MTAEVSSVRMPDIYFDFKMKCINNHIHALDMTEELPPSTVEDRRTVSPCTWQWMSIGISRIIHSKMKIPPWKSAGKSSIPLNIQSKLKSNFTVKQREQNYMVAMDIISENTTLGKFTLMFPINKERKKSSPKHCNQANCSIFKKHPCRIQSTWSNGRTSNDHPRQAVYHPFIVRPALKPWSICILDFKRASDIISLIWNCQFYFKHRVFFKIWSFFF